MENVQKFQNPIIPGFAPDPSVVMVDGIFYLVTSSFHIFPGLPIYASRDLQNWKHIGKILYHHIEKSNSQLTRLRQVMQSTAQSNSPSPTQAQTSSP